MTCGVTVMDTVPVWIRVDEAPMPEPQVRTMIMTPGVVLLWSGAEAYVELPPGPREFWVEVWVGWSTIRGDPMTVDVEEGSQIVLAAPGPG